MLPCHGVQKLQNRIVQFGRNHPRIIDFSEHWKQEVKRTHSSKVLQFCPPWYFVGVICLNKSVFLNGCSWLCHQHYLILKLIGQHWYLQGCIRQVLQWVFATPYLLQIRYFTLGIRHHMISKCINVNLYCLKYDNYIWYHSKCCQGCWSMWVSD